MFRNYLLVTFRLLRRNWAFSLINIAGLSLGISAALVIFLIVHYDFSFDKFHPDANRIYRVVEDGTRDGQEFHQREVPLPLIPVMSTEVTGLEGSAPFYTCEPDMKVVVPGVAASGGAPQVFRDQQDIVFAGDQYFRVFRYEWLAGSPGDAVQEPYQVVLTEGRARAYFPGVSYSDMIGRTLVYFDSVPMKVTGVVKGLEEKGNTDFVFKEFLSFPTMSGTSLKDIAPWDWHALTSSTQLFVKLSKGNSPAAIEAQLKTLLLKYIPEDTKGRRTYAWHLQPLSQLHLDGDYGSFDTVRQAHLPTLYGLLFLGVILLLLACINFVNLTTAMAGQRAREIGIRKAIGSSKGQLVFQFLQENFWLTLMAALVSVALVPLLLKVFADFIPTSLHLDWYRQPLLWIVLLVLLVGVSLLSGFYPALVLSRFQPVKVLKGQGAISGQGTQRSLLRRTLTVFQFVVAQFFIIATLLVSKQIHYVLSQDLGFRKEAIVYVSLPVKTDSLRRTYPVLEDKVRALPGVERVSLGGDIPSSQGMTSMTFTYNNGKKEMGVSSQLKYGDTNYLSLYQIPLVAGRNVEPSDTMRELVINENLAAFLGFKKPADAVGQYLVSGPAKKRGPKLAIVGVMKDFHSADLHQPIRRLLFTSFGRRTRYLHIALKPQTEGGEEWSTTLAAVEKNFRRLYPETVYQVRFFDETIASFYKSEQDISRLLKWATGIAVFISCLGMLGLVMYTTNMRTKEIGIRKVLGASVRQIVLLLSRDFMLLVVLAFMIALPLSWWAMHRWLDNYAYRTEMSWWVFGLAALGMSGVAFLTLSLQTFRSARANPVESLRTE